MSGHSASSSTILRQHTDGIPSLPRTLNHLDHFPLDTAWTGGGRIHGSRWSSIGHDSGGAASRAEGGMTTSSTNSNGVPSTSESYLSKLLRVTLQRDMRDRYILKKKLIKRNRPYPRTSEPRTRLLELILLRLRSGKRRGHRDTTAVPPSYLSLTRPS